MKVLVCSDSHSMLDVMVDAVLRERPDVILHLGDHDTDAAALSERFPAIPLHAVRGNNDFSLPTPLERLVWLDGAQVLMTHGHRYRVKQGLQSVRYRGIECGANVTLFGHTHEACLYEENGRWLMNPGPASHGYYGAGIASYDILRIEAGAVRCEIVEIQP